MTTQQTARMTEEKAPGTDEGGWSNESAARCFTIAPGLDPTTWSTREWLLLESDDPELQYLRGPYILTATEGKASI